ncbi:hypothetical protein COLO4_19607 [Corchorus olitorius]|uniref:Uncharacterized protein n=1 Tax=Corchorus olitorius TaxID=93759 RepID=A0A1R3J4H7_9ROSI|nr:hypothetical protein COLO4_19607 [Corchorus olitorius]
MTSNLEGLKIMKEPFSAIVGRDLQGVCHGRRKALGVDFMAVGRAHNQSDELYGEIVVLRVEVEALQRYPI